MSDVAQPTAFAPALSHDSLTLGDGGATATNRAKGVLRPAALVAVGRGGGAEGFALAAVVEALPKLIGSFSFGVGRAMPKEGKRFNDADGTCGLYQSARSESARGAATAGFGRRADHDDDQLGPPIVQGSRLALHLSARGAEGTRTARFFVDKEEVAVFVDIEDDGGDSDWVTGVTLSIGACVRLVPAEGVELIPFLTEAEKNAAAEKVAAEKRAAEARVVLTKAQAADEAAQAKCCASGAKAATRVALVEAETEFKAAQAALAALRPSEEEGVPPQPEPDPTRG